MTRENAQMVAIGGVGALIGALLMTVRYGWPLSAGDVAFIVLSPIIAVGIAWQLWKHGSDSTGEAEP